MAGDERAAAIDQLRAFPEAALGCERTARMKAAARWRMDPVRRLARRRIALATGPLDTRESNRSGINPLDPPAQLGSYQAHSRRHLKTARVSLRA